MVAQEPTRMGLRRNWLNRLRGDQESLLPTDAHAVLPGLLRVMDVLMVVGGALIAYYVQNDTLTMPFYYQAAIILAGLFTANFLQIAGVYRWSAMERLSVQMFHTGMCFMAVFGTLIAIAYFTGTSDWFNRGWVLWWFTLSNGSVAALRLGALVQMWRLRQRGGLTINVAVIGSHRMGAAVVRQLLESQGDTVKLLGVWDDQDDRPESVEGCPVRGTVDDLVLLSRQERIDEIVLAMVDRPASEVEKVLAKLRPVPINTKLCAHSLMMNIPVRGYTSFAGLPLLDIHQRPLSGWGGIWKQLEDWVFGVVILIMMLPVMALCALAIRLDSPGPILFRQKRYGFNNNDITVFKFRTMYHQRPPEPGVPQAKKNDPRITKVGAFLRKTSLDELPQLFNVLRGEMSLVGPRPHAVAHNEQYAQIIDGYLGRHRVKPGITGWAQVNGFRGETDTPEKMRMRVQYDLYYIDHWSLVFDIKILALTGLVGFVNRNAY